ncbi:MAG: DUF4138 domain-containing protein [Calditrichaeota bacterium]|nr:MAG: DUF4138 domain-containing protein [Calditrichota bacterium]
MKRFLTLCTVVGLLLSTNLHAQQQKKLVRVKPGFATVIVCPAPPDLVTIGNAKQFSIQNSGNFILVKPLVSQGSTNMFIKAGANSYHLILTVSATPDLEVKLAPNFLASKSPPPPVTSNSGNDHNHVGAAPDIRTDSRKRELRRILSRARSILPAYLRKPRRYTYSVKESNVILALDYMVQIQDKLFVICTLVNNSKIPYDIGFVRFKLKDQARSMLFFSKTTKETELEPIQELYRQSIKPKSFGRMLFIFDKQGFTNKSKLEIKCIEERGHRDLVLEAPGSYVE